MPASEICPAQGLCDQLDDYADLTDEEKWALIGQLTQALGGENLPQFVECALTRQRRRCAIAMHESASVRGIISSVK